jgi:hypothetical protein
MLASVTIAHRFMENHAMPTISMFYGIIICLYFYDDERHKLPHIHAKY